nr:hypothetical protein [Candidatus Sigynarchaeota archaeon]
MPEDNEDMSSLKDKLLAELKQQLADEIKEDLKKELASSVPSTGKGKKKEPKEQLPDAPVTETSAVLSSTGRIEVPKTIIKSLGWGKGDVIELKAENGKLVGTRVGHTDVQQKKAAKDESQAAKDVPVEDVIATSAINVGKYFDFDFAERPVMGKMKQVLENALQLYTSSNYSDGFKVLRMIEGIELKEEEPDRSKMRIAVVKFLNDMLPRDVDASVIQWPMVKDLYIDKANSRYLREKGYALMADGWKKVNDEKAKPYFEQVMSTLFEMLGKYQITEMYAIISLLETIMKLVKGTQSPHVGKLIDYFKGAFNQVDDIDYKIRFIRMLTELEAFKDAKDLARAFKETTTEGSGERRLVLDCLKENREKEKTYFEKHPELAEAGGMEEDDEEYLTELRDAEKKKKGTKKKQESAPENALAQEAGESVPAGDIAHEETGDQEQGDGASAGEGEVQDDINDQDGQAGDEPEEIGGEDQDLDFDPDAD